MHNPTSNTGHFHPRCTEEPWCTVNEPSEHAEFHAGDIAHHEPGNGDDWITYLVRDTDGDVTSLVLEGTRGDRIFETVIPVPAARALLEATQDAELLATIKAVLSQVVDR